MSMQNVYDKYFRKLLEDRQIKVACLESNIPKLRAGLYRSQKNHQEFLARFGGESYELQKISISYNPLESIATVELKSYKDSSLTGFELL